MTLVNVDLTIDKSTVGLDQVDNTSDLDKPISTAVQDALDNLPTPVDTIVVQTAAQWALDVTVYSEKRILVTSDSTYTGTNVRKFKISDGVLAWSALDYVPINLLSFLSQDVSSVYIADDIPLSSLNGASYIDFGAGVLLNLVTPNGILTMLDTYIRVYHNTLLKLDSPIINVVNGTASKMLRLDASKNLVASSLDESDIATVTDLSNKVDKVTGKGLSTEDYTTAEKTKVSNLIGTNTGDQDLSGLVVKNTAITGATKTKITYDSKGLVTSGADATTADIADSTNKRYVTDANLTVIGNTSNTNTGDETAARIATINHGTSAKTTLVDGDEITGQDSASSFSLLRVTCLNLYNYLKGKFDTVYTTTAAVATQITTALSGYPLTSDSRFTDARANKVFAYANTDVTHTGDTNECVCASISIPANSLGANDRLRIESLVGKVGTAGVGTYRMYMAGASQTINAVFNATGTTKIGTFQGNILSAGFKRRIQNKNSATSNVVVSNVTSYVSEETTNITAARVAVNIDFTAQQYFIMTYQLNTGTDTARLDDVQLFIDKP